MKTITVLFTALILMLVINANAQWVQMSNGMGTDKTIGYLASLGNNVFASTLGNKSTGLIFRSSNNGVDWIDVGWSLPGNDDVHCIAVLGSNIYAGTSGGTSGAVWMSSDNGSTWVKTSLDNHDVITLTVIGTTIYAGTWWHSGTYGIYSSTNNGISWEYLGLGGPNQVAYSFAKLNNYLFAGTNDEGVYVSTNNGLNWTQSGLFGSHIRTLAVLGNKVFAGTDSSGLQVTTNYGANWSQTSINHGFVFSLIVSGSNILAGAADQGVLISTDNGVTWVQKNEGFYMLVIVTPIFISNNYLFAGSYGQSVWRRPLSEVIGIQTTGTEIPSAFSLSQNYPNPFNPVTKMRFDIPLSRGVSEEQGVLLAIYDALGREVAVLVNEDLKPGTYEADWNASSFPSGVYFYTLRTDGYTETKRMVLIK